jgi:hypothetical protein
VQPSVADRDRRREDRQSGSDEAGRAADAVSREDRRTLSAPGKPFLFVLNQCPPGRSIRTRDAYRALPLMGAVAGARASRWSARRARCAVASPIGSADHAVSFRASERIPLRLG